MKGSWLNSICMKWEEELHQFTNGWFFPFRRCCFCNSLESASLLSTKQAGRQAHSLSNGVAVAGSATLHLANSEPSAHGVWQHLARGAVAFPFVEEPEAHRLRQVKHPVDGLKGFRVVRYLLFLFSRYFWVLFHIAEFIQKHNCLLSFMVSWNVLWICISTYAR